MAYNATLGSPDQTALISVEALAAGLADRTDGTVLAAKDTAVLQKVATTATVFWDAIRWQGVRVWPTLQRLEWPRHAGIRANLAVDLATTGVDRTRHVLHRYTLGATVSSGSATSAVVAALASRPEEYPDDWFNEGSVRVTSSGSNNYQVRRITDFAAASGTLTVEAFGDTLAGESIEILPPLHPLVVNAFVELCIQIDRESDGYSDRDRDGSPEALTTAVVDRLMRKYVRRSFDVV